MSLFYEAKQESYGKTRRVSAGATITLVCKSGEYVATFQCAKRVAEVLGQRGLEERGDGILESVPVYLIPIEEMPGACEKLSKRFSIALVDIAYEKGESRFALVYKIDRKGEETKAERDLMAEFLADEPEQAKAPVSVDDF